MSRAILQAALTGAFCIVFALVVDVVTDVLSLAPVIGLAFVSGSLGSLFAQAVVRRQMLRALGERPSRQEPE